MLGSARLLVRFVPFRLWRGWMGSIGSTGAAHALDAEDRARALLVRRWVDLAAGNLPFDAVCLPRAIAARWMLARRGIASELHLGARASQDEGKPIELHAWLSCGELDITGGRQRRGFTAFGRPSERLGN